MTLKDNAYLFVLRKIDFSLNMFVQFLNILLPKERKGRNAITERCSENAEREAHSSTQI